MSIALNLVDLSLNAKAVTIGELTDMARFWQPPDLQSFSELPQTDIFSRFRHISTWIESQSSSYSSHPHTPETFWRTLVADLVVKNLRTYRSQGFPDFSTSLAAFTRLIFRCAPGKSDNETPEGRAEIANLDKRASLYVGCLTVSVGRRLAILESGVPFLVPGDTAIGDFLYVLTGAPLPLVLQLEGDRLRSVGCCYVHGVMDGELFADESALPAITEIVIGEASGIWTEHWVPGPKRTRPPDLRATLLAFGQRGRSINGARICDMQGKTEIDNHYLYMPNLNFVHSTRAYQRRVFCMSHLQRFVDNVDEKTRGR